MELKRDDNLEDIAEDEVLFAGMSMWGNLLEAHTRRAFIEIVCRSPSKNKIIYLGDDLLRYTLALKRIINECPEMSQAHFDSSISQIMELDSEHYSSEIKCAKSEFLAAYEEGGYRNHKITISLHSEARKIESMKENFFDCIDMYKENKDDEFRTSVNELVLSFMKRCIKKEEYDRLPDFECQYHNEILGKCVSLLIENPQFNKENREIEKYTPIINKAKTNSSVRCLLALCFGYVLEELAGFKAVMDNFNEPRTVHFVYPGILSVVGNYFNFLHREKNTEYAVKTRNIKKHLISSKKALSDEKNVRLSLSEQVKLLHQENRLLIERTDALFTQVRALALKQEEIKPDCKESATKPSVQSDNLIADYYTPEGHCFNFDYGDAIDENAISRQKQVIVQEPPIEANLKSLSRARFYHCAYFNDGPIHEEKLLVPDTEKLPVLEICFTGYGRYGLEKLVSLIAGVPLAYLSRPTCNMKPLRIRWPEEGIRIEPSNSAEKEQAILVTLPYYGHLLDTDVTILYIDLSREDQAPEMVIDITKYKKWTQNFSTVILVGIVSTDKISKYAFDIFVKIQEDYCFNETRVLYCGIVSEQVKLLRESVKVLSREFVPIMGIEKMSIENRLACESLQIREFLLQISANLFHHKVRSTQSFQLRIKDLIIKPPIVVQKPKPPVVTNVKSLPLNISHHAAFFYDESIQKGKSLAPEEKKLSLPAVVRNTQDTFFNGW